MGNNNGRKVVVDVSKKTTDKTGEQTKKQDMKNLVAKVAKQTVVAQSPQQQQKTAQDHTRQLLSRIPIANQTVEVWHMVSHMTDEGIQWSRDNFLGPKYVETKDLAAFFRRHPEYNARRAVWHPVVGKPSIEEVYSELPFQLKM